MFRHLLIACVAAALIGAVTASAQARASDRPETAVTVSFGTNTVTASGITPGKSAVFFGVGFRGPNDTARLVRWKKVVTDDDGSGQATLNLGEWPARGSLFAVVDLESGRYAIAAPPDSPYNLAPMPQHPLRRGRESGEVDRMAFDHPVMELLYVDPGKGAWAWSARDGATLDKDGPNGQTTIDLSDGVSLTGHDAPPQRFLPRGVLVAIDWYKRAILVTAIQDHDIEGAN